MIEVFLFPAILNSEIARLAITVQLITNVLAHHNKWWSCNSECARCVRMVLPMEELIVQFYPGLFSQTPPENIHLTPEMTSFGSSMLHSGTAEIPGSGGFEVVSTNVSRSANNPTVWQVQPRGRTKQPVVPGCCETEMEYVTPPNVTIRGEAYQVVHLRHAFQFIPIGKCREGSKCSLGDCVEQHRAHWVLVYNSTATALGPPVSFSAIEVPSHCECMNVGRP